MPRHSLSCKFPFMKNFQYFFDLVVLARNPTCINHNNLKTKRQLFELYNFWFYNITIIIPENLDGDLLPLPEVYSRLTFFKLVSAMLDSLPLPYLLVAVTAYHYIVGTLVRQSVSCKNNCPFTERHPVHRSRSFTPAAVWRHSSAICATVIDRSRPWTGRVGVGRRAYLQRRQLLRTNHHY